MILGRGIRGEGKDEEEEGGRGGDKGEGSCEGKERNLIRKNTLKERNNR